MNVYQNKLNGEEIKEWVHRYYEDVKGKKNSRFNAIIKLVKGNNKRILDYGCGWGYLSKHLSSQGHNVIGIDLNQNEIDICKLVWGNGDNLSFQKKQINELKDNSFEIVISSQVVEHVHNAGNYLSEINRVLSRGGELIITLPNILTPKFIILNGRKKMQRILKRINNDILKNYDKRHLHINAWDPLHFTQLISTLGFEVIEFSTSEGLIFPFNKYINIPFLKNYSYTMCFRLKKVRRVELKSFD
jgi:2-polyprenyl-3-methyl-5-hydroxy-6-metoxy-1,4-benzoquinol methylase